MSLRRFAALLTVNVAAVVFAAPPDSTALQFKEFAKEPMVRNVAAVTVDEQGRVYATSVVRRQAADLDIRRFREWIEADLSFTSVEQKRAFFKRMLTPENSATYADRFEDQNGDGLFDYDDLSLLADQISVLTDTDGDGVADTFRKFNATENSEITGIAAGLAAWDGSLYVTAEPDLLRLTDTDGDGVPDERQVLSHGYSHHIGYGGHNFSGAIIGPDGRLYAAVADRGMNVTTADGVRHYNPHSGAILRSELDGSNFEIYATGLRNLQEPAFDQWGNILGVDNDGDMPGEQERFVYVAEGSDTGWRTSWQYRSGLYNPWQDEGLDVPPHAGQPAYLFPALNNYKDGPAGFAFNPGTALSPAYKDYFFLSAFPSRNLYAFQAEPAGAAFRMVNEHTAARGVLMVGLSFGPDGKLYLADWSSDGYAMNEKGAVWTLDDPAYAQSELRRETTALIATDWRAMATADLTQHLAHADQRVRMKAQFELARRNDTEALLSVATHASADPLARGHAIWGLGQLLRQGHTVSSDALVALLAADDAELRAQTAKIISEARPALADASAALVPLLADTADRPRFMAAIALGRLQHPDAVPALLDYARRDAADPYHRHAIAMGLAGCATAEQLAALVDASTSAERLAAVVALRRQRSPLVARFLSDADPLVASEAATAIYDDESIPDALPALATLLDQPGDANDRTLRRALSAALRLRSGENAARVAAFATKTTHETALRLHALDLLRNWGAPPKLDPVQGLFHDLPTIDPTSIADTVAPALRTLAKDSDPKLARAAWEASAAFQLEPDTADLIAIVGLDTPLAADALLALQTAHAPGLAKAATQALQSQHADVRVAALQALAQADPTLALTTAVKWSAGNDVPEARASLAILATNKSYAALAAALSRLQTGNLLPALALDVLEAIASTDDAALIEQVAAYQDSKDASDPLSPYIETLHGGDAVKGQAIFQTSVTAQCTLCHRVNGPGSNVGPQLNRIGEKSATYLLQALVDPGAVVADGFGFATVILKNGEAVGGTLMKETPESVTIKLADGATQTVAITDIAERTPVMSSMPPMGQLMSRLELRDLLAYLQTLRGRNARNAGGEG